MNKLKKIIGDYDAWQKYSRKDRKKWANHWKLWNNERVKKGYKSTSNSFEPMVFQMTESRVDNTYGSRPQPTYLATIPQQETDTKMLAEHFAASWRRSDMDLYIVPIGRELEICGNVCVFTGWEDGYMTMLPVPMNDCILDPSATRPDQMRYAGYRRLDMIDNLKRAKRFDAEKGEWVPKYKNLNKLKTWSGSGDDDKLAADLRKKCYEGSTLPDDQKDGQVEVIYMAYLDTIYEIANRTTIICEYPNPFQLTGRQVVAPAYNDAEKLFDENSLSPEIVDRAQMGEEVPEEEVAANIDPAVEPFEVPDIEPFLPVAMGRVFIDLALLLAKGSVEPIADNQEDLNDEINIKKDNLIWRQQNSAFVDRSQADELIPLLAQKKPGSLIPADNIQDGKLPVHWEEKPELANDTDIEINRLKQSIRDTVRVDQVVQGVGTQQGRTATEINAQVAGASSGFKSQTKNLQHGLYKALCEQHTKMVQIFLGNDKKTMRVQGQQGPEFATLDGSKYFGPYDIEIVLEDEAEAAKKHKADKALEAYNAFRGDPSFNQYELAKATAQKAFDMDPEELKLLMNPNPMNMAMAGGMPAGDVTTPGAPMPPQPPMMQPMA